MGRHFHSDRSMNNSRGDATVIGQPRRRRQATPHATALQHALDASGGSASYDQLLEVSSWSSLRAAVRRGDIEHVYPGVYLDAARAEEFEPLARAAILWAPSGSRLAGRTALYLAGIGSPPAQIYIATPGQQWARAPQGVRLVRSKCGERRVGSTLLPRVPNEIALIQAWASTTPRAREDLAYRCLWKRTIDPQRLLDAIATTPRVAQRAVLTQWALNAVDGATSPLEVKARREVFIGDNFADVEWQAAVLTSNQRFVADALHRESKTILEFDGATYHSGSNARQRDMRRDTALAAAGYVTMRFSWRDLSELPGEAREAVLQTVARRMPTPPSGNSTVAKARVGDH